MNPLELYKAVEPRYDAICDESNSIHFNSKKVMDNISRQDVSQWCTVKTDLVKYLPNTPASLDAGCGSVKRGGTGFDLQDGVSYRKALDIYPEGSFQVVTSYGGVHSAIGTKRLPWLQTTSNVKTEDPEILRESNPFVTLQQFVVDRGLLNFHTGCLAYWSKDYVGFTVRSRHCDFDYLNRLAEQFNCTTEKTIVHDEDRYVNKLIEIFNNYTGEDRLAYLKKLYIIRNHYLNDPPIGVVWRKNYD